MFQDPSPGLSTAGAKPRQRIDHANKLSLVSLDKLVHNPGEVLYRRRKLLI